ncbi:10523_t:CDS:1, partial [Funneliformis mosseae]
MASTSLYIPDMRLAVEQKTVPGSFRKNKTIFEFPTLSYVEHNGKNFLWTIRVCLIRFRDDSEPFGHYVPILTKYLDGRPLQSATDTFIAEISVEARQEGGKIRDAKPTC